MWDNCPVQDCIFAQIVYSRNCLFDCRQRRANKHQPDEGYHESRDSSELRAAPQADRTPFSRVYGCMSTPAVRGSSPPSTTRHAAHEEAEQYLGLLKRPLRHTGENSHRHCILHPQWWTRGAPSPLRLPGRPAMKDETVRQHFRGHRRLDLEGNYLLLMARRLWSAHRGEERRNRDRREVFSTSLLCPAGAGRAAGAELLPRGEPSFTISSPASCGRAELGFVPGLRRPAAKISMAL